MPKHRYAAVIATLLLAGAAAPAVAALLEDGAGGWRGTRPRPSSSHAPSGGTLQQMIGVAAQIITGTGATVH